MSDNSEWLNTFKESYQQFQEQGGFLVLFPEYRPDMTRALAFNCGLDFYDYRKEKMLSQGWEAGKISLSSLTKTLLEASSNSGLVVHNAEALLATKPDDERKQWLADFLSVDWKNPVILPLALYQSDAPLGDPRVCDLKILGFPKESFLMRLAM